MHIGIDAQTLEIRAIEVTSSSVGDAPMLPELLLATQPPSSRHARMGNYEGEHDGSQSTQRDLTRDSPSWPDYLEKVERLSPKKSGGNQDALLQAIGGTGDGARL